MTLATEEILRAQQAAAERARDRMMTLLLGFDAAQRLKVEDVKFIAEMTRTYAFDACKDVDA